MGKFENKKESKKQTKTYIKMGIGAMLILFLAVMPMVAANSEAESAAASILSATVEKKSIDIQLVGGGQLDSEASLNVRIPEHVKLMKYLVGNGDTVQNGDPIAKVDRVSVMSAITEVQETLDHLTKEIASALEAEESNTVRAKAAGVVKVIYGQRGESVQDVMLRDGSLAVLSLDGLMAVKIERRTDLDIGDAVCVYLPDGTEVTGRVVENQDSVLTVTIEDNKYAVGTKVTVETEDGDRIGFGELYIYSQWNATAYSGTISDIQVRENEKVAAGRVLFLVEKSGNTAQFQRLVDQRQEYEQLMQELFNLYRTETLTAPCDGIVAGVDKDGAYLLATEKQGLAAQLLSFLGMKEKNGYTAFAVQVTEVTDDGMQLKIDPSADYVDDLTQLSAASVELSSMTESWNYVGDITVYKQTESGILRASGTAQEGDLLLMVGSEEQMGWFVVVDEETAEKNSDKQQKTGFMAVLTSLMAFGEEQEPDAGDTAQQTEEDAEEEQDGFSGNQWFRPHHPDRPEDEGDDENENEEDRNDPPAPGESEDPDDPDDPGESEELDDSDDPDDPDTDNQGATTYYLGYIAQVSAISDGTMTVKQQQTPYAVTSLDALSSVVVDSSALTKEATYTSTLIAADSAAAGDYLCLTVALDGGSLVGFAKYTVSSGSNGTGNGETPGDSSSAMGEGMINGMPSGSGMPGGMTEIGQSQAFELYSLEQLTVATVTSQEHMTVAITIDELDISKVYIGQSATVTMDALAGETFAATVTKIANSGENEGGNSKFSVELTLEKSGDMIPGMTASARIVLDTVSDVLCIPVAALTEENGKTVVYTSYDPENGVLGTPVEISIGAADADTVQVLSDLEEGSTFYYAYYDTLEREEMLSMGARPF